MNKPIVLETQAMVDMGFLEGLARETITKWMLEGSTCFWEITCEWYQPPFYLEGLSGMWVPKPETIRGSLSM